MPKSTERLGKGLDALIPTDIDDFVAKDVPEQVRLDQAVIEELPLQKIDPNPHQPRTEFRESELDEMAASIRIHGILQPIVVSKAAGGRYELIAGERRLRASKKAGRTTIPAIIRSFSEQQQLEVAMIENVQRANLKPLEQAAAYYKLMTQFNLSQEQIGKQVGKATPTISNSVRLLSLEPASKAALNDGRISEGHAKALLMCKNAPDQVKLLAIMLKNPITVRQAEDYARNFNSLDDPRALPIKKRQAIVNALTERLEKALSTKVTLHPTSKGGKIVIQYYSDEELQRIIESIAQQ